MSANFHPLVYFIDYLLGVIMWTLIGRVAMNIFQKENSEFFFMKIFVKYTNPLLKIFKPITPSFIIGPLVPLYVAWFFFMIRFYLMPYLLGYSVMGMLSFPLESEISRNIYQLFNVGKFAPTRLYNRLHSWSYNVDFGRKGCDEYFSKRRL